MERQDVRKDRWPRPGYRLPVLCGATVLLIVLLGAWYYFTRDNDPFYEGKRLSAHLAVFQYGGVSLGSVTKEMGRPARFVEPGAQFESSGLEARAAISAVGTNALPLLVHMLQAKDSRTRRWMWSTLEKSAFLREHFHIRPTPTGWMKQLGALAAFRELGPRAAPAIPEIIPMLDDPDLAQVALVALKYIRPQRQSDILSLTRVLRIKTTSSYGASPAQLHTCAILTLATFGTNAVGAVPALMIGLKSTNQEVQAASGFALLRIGAPPEEVVPLILDHIPKTNLPRSYFASAPPAMAGRRFAELQSLEMNVMTLGRYGHHASAALPLLTNLESYPLANLQEEAREAMEMIKEDAAAARTR